MNASSDAPVPPPYHPGLTRGLRLLLLLGILTAAALLISTGLQLQLLQEGGITGSAALANNQRQRVVAIADLMVWLTTVGVFGTWIFKTHQFVRSRGAAAMPISPGLAVGYFFIPILNLWKPYQAMQQLYRASVSPQNWKEVEPLSLIKVWWVLWLTCTAMGRISSYSMRKAGSYEDVVAATEMILASQSCSILLGWVAWLVVGKIASANQLASGNSRSEFV